MLARMFSYTVCASFEGADASLVARDYEAWLVDGHLRDVVEAGALEATLLKLEGAAPQLEVHYVFSDAGAFARYEQGPAVALRAEGAAKFPASRGVRLTRRVGAVVSRVGRAG
jgi:hypothetical protein